MDSPVFNLQINEVIECSFKTPSFKVNKLYYVYVLRLTMLNKSII